MKKTIQLSSSEAELLKSVNISASSEHDNNHEIFNSTHTVIGRILRMTAINLSLIILTPLNVGRTCENEEISLLKEQKESISAGPI